MANARCRKLQAQARWLDDLNWDATGYTTRAAALGAAGAGQGNDGTTGTSALCATCRGLGIVSTDGCGNVPDLSGSGNRRAAGHCQQLLAPGATGAPAAEGWLTASDWHGQARG
jgi:hypothetical protein